MQGKRVKDGIHPTNPGEYAKTVIDGNVCWIMIVPTGSPALIIGRPNSDGSPYHWIKENEDGTITVEPNPPDAPLERRNSNSIGWNDWHGYIREGVWISA